MKFVLIILPFFVLLVSGIDTSTREPTSQSNRSDEPPANSTEATFIDKNGDNENKGNKSEEIQNDGKNNTQLNETIASSLKEPEMNETSSTEFRDLFLNATSTPRNATGTQNSDSPSKKSINPKSADEESAKNSSKADPETKKKSEEANEESSRTKKRSNGSSVGIEPPAPSSRESKESTTSTKVLGSTPRSSSRRGKKRERRPIFRIFQADLKQEPENVTKLLDLIKGKFKSLPESARNRFVRKIEGLLKKANVEGDASYEDEYEDEEEPGSSRGCCCSCCRGSTKREHYRRKNKLKSKNGILERLRVKNIRRAFLANSEEDEGKDTSKGKRRANFRVKNKKQTTKAAEPTTTMASEPTTKIASEPTTMAPESTTANPEETTTLEPRTTEEPTKASKPTLEKKTRTTRSTRSKKKRLRSRTNSTGSATKGSRGRNKSGAGRRKKKQTADGKKMFQKSGVKKCKKRKNRLEKSTKKDLADAEPKLRIDLENVENATRSSVARETSDEQNFAVTLAELEVP